MPEAIPKDLVDQFGQGVMAMGANVTLLTMGCKLITRDLEIAEDDRSLWEKRKFLLDCFLLIVVNLGLDLENMGEESLLEMGEGGKAWRDNALRFYELIKDFEIC